MVENNRADYISTGLELKDWRIAAGFTQKDLAQLFECTRQTIVRMETSEFLPREWKYAFTFLRRYPEEFATPSPNFIGSSRPRRRKGD
jgi:DNA-binding XRE family transcriptional regulator